MATERITLDCDPDDYREIMAEFERRKDDELPEGESNDEAAMIAEMVRDLNEYRAMADINHPPAKRIGIFRPETTNG